ncbi:MAG TPA: sugar transferase, partial [Methylovirgula sp.]|nr:sugar transferase [Methylovirgula sp.]
MIQPLFVLFDATAILLASVLGLVVYYFLRADFMDLESYAGVDIFAISVYAASASYFRLYRFRQLNRSGLEFKSVLVSWAAVLFCLTVCLFLMKLGSHVSRATITAFLVIALPSLLISRSISKSFFKTAIQTSLIRGRRAIVVGTHDELVSISQEHLLSHYGIDEGERITLPAREANESHTEAVAREAAGRARIIRAGEVVLALPWDDDVRLRLVLKHLRTLPIPASLLPDRSARSLLEGHNSTFAEELLIPVKRAPLGPFARLAKRSFDTVIAAGLILAFSPVMIVAALAIRLDSKGPVIFRQQRRGFNGETFVIYKFRTMSVMEDGGKIIQAKKGDPRLTRVGGLLRRSSIDELPQLFNVL